MSHHCHQDWAKRNEKLGSHKKLIEVGATKQPVVKKDPSGRSQPGLHYHPMCWLAAGRPFPPSSVELFFCSDSPFTATALPLPKFLDAITRNKNVEETQRGQVMELIQAFLLGMMVAWTPSLIVLAVLVVREEFKSY